MARFMSLFSVLFLYSAVAGNIPQTFAKEFDDFTTLVAEPSTTSTIVAEPSTRSTLVAEPSTRSTLVAEPSTTSTPDAIHGFAKEFDDFTTLVAEPLSTSTLDAIRGLAKEFKDFKTQLSRIEARLTSLQMSTEPISKSGDIRCSARSIADTIRLSNYKLAEQELIELNNDDMITIIVHDLYAGSSANVHIILEFAISLKSAETKCLVFSALYDEMRSSGSNDALELIILASELDRLSMLVSEEIKIKMQVMVKNIVEDMKIAASRTLKAAMIANKFEDNDQVDTLTTALLNFRSDVIYEVMEEIVDQVFGVVGAERITDNVCSSKHIQVVIAGLGAVFNRLNFTDNLNNDVILKLASNLEKLQFRENYAGLSQPLKYDVDELIGRLPSCVSSMFFGKSVCLWNKGRNAYMYAADSSLKYDHKRRSVFTYAGDPKPGAFWNVERKGTEIFFRNLDYANEYLYAAWMNYDLDKRYVFTWIPGKNTDVQSVWTVELNGGYCYLKSGYYNEYLFGASVRYNDMNSHVFTSITGKCVKSDAEYLWQLRDCS